MKIAGIEYPGLESASEPSGVPRHGPKFYFECNCGWKVRHVEADMNDVRYHAAHCPQARQQNFQTLLEELDVKEGEIEGTRFMGKPLTEYDRGELATIIVWLSKDHPHIPYGS